MADSVQIDSVTGGQVAQKSTAQAAHVLAFAAPGIAFSGAATTQTAATLATLTGLLGDEAAFEVASISGTTPAIKVYPSFNGTNYSATPLALTDLSSGTLGTGIAGATGATAVGNYKVAIPLQAQALRIDYTASVAGSTSIRGVTWKR